VVRGITLLHQMLDQLMFNQRQIGELIDLNLISQRRDEAIIGDCMNCEDGKLKLIRSLSSGKRFVGCSNYFTEIKCNTTYPLPQREKLDLTLPNCTADGYPTLRVFPIFDPNKKRQRPWVLCLNPECPKRKERQEEIEKSKKRAKERKAKKTSKKSSTKTTDKSTKHTTKKATKKLIKRSKKK
ncbi:MAG: DNA topoisomerase 1, partial [Candidatus Heimdallarchaeota archaeon LC_2]